MANNYLQFSTSIPTPKEHRQALLDAIDKFEQDECLGVCVSEEESGEEELIVWSEESGDIEGLAKIVAQWQKDNNITKPWTCWKCFYAETCDKPRLDEFSGGAVVVFQGKQYWMNAGDWAETKAKEITK